MNTLGTTEDYRYCDTGAASGQSDCGQTTGEYCGKDAVEGQCEVSDRVHDERGYFCNTGAASGQSTCGQTADECDECCC